MISVSFCTDMFAVGIKS